MARTVNKELLHHYWFIGNAISLKKQQSQWGSSFFDQLAKDLQAEFPETKGYSARNLRRMEQFARTFPDPEILPQGVAKLPWSHIFIILERIKDETARLWYMDQGGEGGWSRDALEVYIDTNLYHRQGQEEHKTHNFHKRLPQQQALQAVQILKDPYNLDFIGAGDWSQERFVERALVANIRNFLLELGAGFAFVGQQVPILVDEQEYWIDLLFYHLELHSYVVVELKSTSFKPEHTGQLNFYLSAVDELKKKPEDNPTIGLLLCRSKSKIIAEYALRRIESPIGIAEYKLTKAMPNALKQQLPSIEELESCLTERLKNIDEDKI